MPPTKLSPAGTSRLDALLAEHAGKNLPALFFMAATEDRVLYRACRGNVVYGKPESGEVAFRNTLQLYSMTKLATSLACIQLFERGLLSFDSAEVIKTHLPEVCAAPLLLSISDDGHNTEVLSPRTAPLTLRHLLTHTSGLAYDFAHPLQLQWNLLHRVRGPLTRRATVADLAAPLLFEPGADYAYSTGIDWAGLLVERVSGLSLEEYFHTHIFGPVGISPDDLTFYPSDSIRRRLVHMSGRTGGGTGAVVPSKGWRDVAAMTPADIRMASGGAGLLGTLDAYMQLLQHVLRCHRTPGIISVTSCKELVFSSALPPRAAHATMYTSLGGMMGILGDSTELFTSGEGVAHSLACAVMEADSPHGRRKGSGFWLGAAGTHYWMDPESGLVGICATQILDMAPGVMYDVYNAYERALYDAIDVPAAAL